MTDLGGDSNQAKLTVIVLGVVSLLQDIAGPQRLTGVRHPV
jgi:hypothetical protein